MAFEELEGPVGYRRDDTEQAFTRMTMFAAMSGSDDDHELDDFRVRYGHTPDEDDDEEG
jgi:hypothetical protein